MGDFRFPGRKGACAMFNDPTLPREGDLYKRITVAGHTFELRYGYYEDHERQLCPPVVIFPDLTASNIYCPEGYPLVTQIQDPCEHYKNNTGYPENWCGDCDHFSGEHPEIGICRCEQQKSTLSGGR